MLLNWDDDTSILEMLNRHFRATTFEKYPQVMISVILDQAADKILGKDYENRGYRISKRKSDRLYDFVLKRLQSCYGKYINITQFRIKDRKVHFGTNFSRVYRTDAGILYGCPVKSIWQTIFYTLHTFERFVERYDPFLCEPLIKKLTDIIKTKPTQADILMYLPSTGKGGFEYGLKDNFYYLNIGIGFLVLEDFKEFFVAKTFLSSDMCDPRMSWYKPLLTMEQAAYPSSYFKTVKELLDHDPIKITGPTFLSDIMRDLVKEYIANNPEEDYDKT